MGNLVDDHFQSLIIEGTVRARQGRPPQGARTLTNAEHQAKYRKIKSAAKLQNLAVLDFETDPFEDSAGEIQPFCAELYSDQFGSMVFWNEDYTALIEQVFSAIEALPDAYTIYAHNGGKFDYMFFIHKLRGIVRFKGRAIMSAKIGAHEIRDSLHILPEKLAAWKKDKFDYAKMRKSSRNKFREEILIYLHSDCIYLFDFIKRFTKEFGLKISIGQAAYSELKKHYHITPIKEHMDTALRPYFIGGRVECIGGMGLFESHHWQKPYKLYDVNSMYPHVMTSCKHPIGSEYLWHRGDPNENTCFLDISCKSYGALFHRLETGELSTDDYKGRFQTTIWEYQMALKYGLIENVKIHWCIDNLDRSDFSKFIVPMFTRREETKRIMKAAEKEQRHNDPAYEEIKKENIFLKYLLNNAYGKTAQNPRKYKEYCFTDHGKMPDANWFEWLSDEPDAQIVHECRFPLERTDRFDVWARPSPGRKFNNVGTAASITGAARAMLLEAKQHAIDPIYCDTDSLICRELNNVILDPTKLGAWDLEETFDDVIITGKKTYCCQIAGLPNGHERRLKVRSKGADLRIRPMDGSGIEVSEPTAEQWEAANAATWQRYLSILDGEIITAVNRAPTFHKTGEQYRMTRRIRSTAPLKPRQFGINTNGDARSIQNRR